MVQVSIDKEQKLVEVVVSFFRKSALVQELGMEYGGRRAIEPPPGTRLPSYPSREAALKYLVE